MLFSKAYKAIAAAAMIGVASQVANATEEFLVPFPEDHTLAFLRGISSDASCNGTFAAPDPADPINTITDFVARVDGTVIVVDHWEDGYETVSLESIAANPALAGDATTRIYGDGVLANGAAPGVTTDAGDILIQGQVVVFDETIITATQLNDIEVTGQPITGGGTRTQDGVDGADRIFATETINITRAQWAGTYVNGATPGESSGTLLAGAFELFPQAQWGNSFTVPVGEDTNVDEFEWTGVTIMAANDGTSVSVDVDADGTFTGTGDINAQIINRGETIEILGRNDQGGQGTGGLNQGARIFSSDIVQANIISGEECQNYASRWFTLFPDALLGSTYFEPVSTAVGDETKIYLYNPSLNTITINWETTAGLQPQIIVGPGDVSDQVIPAGTGAKFFTGTTATFGALTVTDQNDTAHDWGHASTSERLMGNIIQVGFAEGDDPSGNSLYNPSQDLSFTVYDGDFTDVSQIDSGTVLTSGTSANIDLQGFTDDTFGIVYQGYINLEEVGDYTFETTSDDGSTLVINGVTVVDNDADQPPTPVTGIYSTIANGGGWLPIEIRYRERTGGQALSASYQPPSAGALAAIPAAILSNFENGPNSPPIGENGAPVWLIADNLEDPTDTQIEICVDVRGDGGPNTDPFTGFTFDYQFTLDRLDSARLYDGGRDTPNTVPAHIDGDQSGMLAFVCDGSDAILAAAWGQAPDTASGGRPAVDVGTTVRSVSADVAFIGDTVFEDENSNGIRDPGERGIENVTVLLTPPAGINLGNGPGQPITTVTDFNGSYLFPGLVSGPYTVEVVPPSGYVQTFDPDASGNECLPLGSAGAGCDSTSSTSIVDAIGRLDQDFGYTNNVTVGDVGDFIYNDANGNGLQDPGELGFPNVDVELCQIGVAGTTVASDLFTTAAYNNEDVLPSSWDTDWIETNDEGTATGTLAGNQGIFVTGGELSIRGNANGPTLTRELDLSSLSNYVLTFDVRGADDTYETGDLVFVEISIDNGPFQLLTTLRGLDFDGTSGSESLEIQSQNSNNVRLQFRVNPGNFFGGGENLFIDNIVVRENVACSTQTTDANGGYLFTSQPAGLYTISVDTTDLPPTAVGFDYVNTDDPDSTGDSANQFTLFSSGGNLEQDFGYFQPASVIGHVYLDTNGNGVQDVGEPNVPNLNIEITDSNGNLQTVVTDANGDYVASVSPGSTQVKLDETDPDYPTGFIQTDGVDPTTVTAVAGITVDAGDDGFYQGNVIGDTVYSELDGTLGAQGASDPGLANVTVTLTPPAGTDLGSGAGIPISTTTDGNGNYSFVGLPDGTYTVSVQQPSGSTQTEDPDGGNDNQSVVTVAGGATDNDQDFGYQNNVPVGQVGDRVFTDTNGNGTQDGGETGIAGIQMQLCGDLDDNDATANTCVTDTTDGNGDYLFTGLPATGVGEVYTVTVLNPPAGQLNSADPDNGLPNFSQLSLSAGGGNLDQDFGYYVPADISGHLYIDTNGDGTQQVGEPDIVNVDVIITDANGDQQTVTTDANGDYSAQVPPGSVTVNIDETDPQFPSNVSQTEGTNPSSHTAVAGVNTFTENDGFVPTGSIGDLIFFDNSASGTLGVFDPGVDSGIPAIVITLTPPGGIDLGNGAGVAITTTTDANGNYLFDSLPAGTYSLSVAGPSGAQQTADPNEAGVCSTCDSASVITIGAAGNDLDQDFGYSTAACPVAAITFDEYTLATATSTTIFDSEYTTGGADNTNSPLAIGRGFTISAVGGENLAVAYNTNAGTNGNDPDLEVSDTGNALIVQESGNTGGIGDGGYIPDDVVGGLLRFDFETPMTEYRNTFVDFESAAGTVRFINSSTGVSVEVRHDDIVAGSGVAAFEQPAADCPTLADEAVCVMTNSITATELSTFGGVTMDSFDRIEYQMVTSGAIDNLNITYDCSTESVVGDLIFEDTNANGTQDPGEPGIAGINVQICGDLDDDDLTPETCRIETTDANGNYLFGDNLTADRLTADPADDPIPLTTGTEDYTIEILNPPAGFVNTADPDGGSVNVSQFTLPSPLPNLEQDFGYSEQAALGDLIFYDFNGDGVFNGNDEGIPGVTVQLDLPSQSNTELAADTFTPRAYDNNPDVGGVAGAWSGDWTEINDDGNVTGGEIEVTAGGELIIGDGGGTTSNDTLQRNIDVTGLSAQLSFEFDLAGTTSAGAGDTLEIIYIANGVETILDTITTVNGGFGAGTRTFTTPNTGSETEVTLGFRVTGVDGAEQIVIDNVSVSSIAPTTLTTVTDANGIYEFDGLNAGTYTITVDPDILTTPTLPVDRINTVPTADPFGPADNISTVTLAAGGFNTDQDFGYQPNQISGNVGEDTNGDNTADVGLENTTVLLYSDPDGDGDASDGSLLATVTTDANGDFNFAEISSTIGVPIDDYVLVEVDPEGVRSVADADTTADAGGDEPNGAGGVGQQDNILPVSIASGEVDEDNNFVDARPASIEGTVWFDEDFDGILDIEEPGITGTTIQLLDGATVIATTTTDALGNYSFENVPTGTYTVRVIQGAGSPQENLTNTAGQFGVQDRPVTVAAGDEVVDQNFGYVAGANEGAIGDRVWADANGDGIQDPEEAGIEGVVLTLRDASGAVVDTATTNSNGDYLFTGIAFGDDYVVSIDPADANLSGYSPTSGPQSEGGYTADPVTLTPAFRTTTEVDFGFNAANLNTVSDTLWFDADADGVLDAGESGISGITVDLINASGDIVASTISDANGNVSFTGLPDGSYRIRVTDNADVLGLLNQTTIEATAGISDAVAVSGGGSSTDTSFGYNNPGLISGVVYNDENSNSDQDPGEAGTPGQTVTLLLDADNNGSFETTVTTTTTGPDGSYEFDGLIPGSYNVVVTPPGGTQTEDPDATVNDETPITLGVGESSVGNDFGYNGNPELFNIDGTVFLDIDADGLEDAGEQGIPGVTLDLLAPSVTVIDGLIDINGDGAISAADDGEYLGVAVIDGRLDIDEDASAGVDAGDDGQVNSIPVIDGGLDVNGDGVVNTADDTQIAAAVIATTTSDANGDYSFTGLPAGDYSVAVTDEAGTLGGYDITSGLDVLGATIPNADVSDVDFGYIRDENSGSISGEVFLDEDGDNFADPSEENFADVDVFICTSPVASEPCNATSPELIAQTVTDANGEYIFTGLPAGNYLVDVDPSDVPASLQNTVNPPAVALSEGEVIEDVDFGYVPSALNGLIAGEVWIDANDNGVLDAGEAPISGVTINVFDPNSASPTVPVASTTTANDGSYSITLTGATLVDDLIVTYGSADIAALPVNLDENQPSNLPAGITAYNGDDVDVASDPDRFIPELDFGFPPEGGANLGSISGVIYSDPNGSGANYDPVTDGEFVGVTINLLNSSGDIIASTQTDENGAYSFTGLVDGDYELQVSDINSVLVDLNVVENDLDVTSVTPITIAAGADITDVNQGYVSEATATLGSIGNLVFIDQDGDGFADDGEPRVEGVSVQCWVDNDNSATPNDPSVPVPGTDPEPGVDNLVRTVLTDENGEYNCTNLPEGQYIVVLTDAANVLDGASDASVNNTGNSAADNFAKPFTYAVTVASGVQNSTADFGVISSTLTGRIAGTVTEDTDGDGTGDTAIEGAFILLYTDPNGDGNPDDGVEIQRVRSDASGDYEFTGVPAGDTDYVVVEVDPADYASVSDTQSGDDDNVENTNTNNNYIPVTLSVGEDDDNNDFVDVVPGSIAGKVWFDEDIDGILDTEEAGLVNVVVELRNNLGVVIGTTVTDQYGNYFFDNLPVGTYTVDVVDSSLPVGLQNTAGVAGVDPKSVPVAQGEAVTDVNFGYIPDDFTTVPTEGAIGDRVWADANGDGIQDQGEAGIAGVTMVLRDSSGTQVATTTTGANGEYLFTNVAFAEDYTVTIDPADAALAGYSPTQGPQSEGGYVSNPVTLTSTASTVTDLDFGFDAPNLNTIVDTVWFDADANEVFDANEEPIADVSINLYTDANNDGIPDDNDGDGQPDVVATAVSDSSGDVTFTGLPDGTYILGVTDTIGQLSGLNGTTDEAVKSQSDAVSVAGGVTNDQDSFGYNNPGLISGVVYNDDNNNSDQDPGEAGISGQTVTLLLDSDNNGSFETTVAVSSTGSDGGYEFDGLPPGDYSVVITPPVGTQTEDPDASVDDSTQINLGVGQSSVSNDFGYNGNPDLYDISGTVFLDDDKDGVEDAGEDGIEAVTLELRRTTEVITTPNIINGRADVDNNGIIDANDDGTFNGVDIVDGQFDLNGDGSIDEVDDTGTAGSLTIIDGVVSIAQAGTASQSSTFSNNLSIFGPDNLINSTIASTSVPGGMSASAGITTTDYWELDLSSVQPLGEITIFNRDDCCIDRLDNMVLLVSDTPFPADPNDFAGALANADLIEVLDTQGGADPDPIIDLSGFSGRYIRLQKAGGNVVNGAPRTNNSNIFNLGELRVTPALIPGDILEAGVIASTTTDANGDYIFTGLPNGDYEVAVTDTGAVLAGFDITSGADVQSAVINNADVIDVDFGYAKDEATASISGEVWIDQDDENGVTNGIADDPEPNLSGITMYLCNSPIAGGGACTSTSPELVATTTTDPQGEYSFTGLSAGSYIVDSEPTDIPAGLDLTVDPAVVPLSEGENVEDVDVGYEPAANTGVLSGFVWTDVNSDGIYQPGEAPIAGVEISVTNDNGTPFGTAVTAGDGSWIITNIANPGALSPQSVGYDEADIPAQLDAVQPTNLGLGNNNYIIDLANDSDFSIGNLDFGFPPNPAANLGSISGTIYSDIDENGDYLEATDNELQGVTINLVDSANPGVVIATTETDVNGEYSFEGLTSGIYFLTLTDQNGITRDLNPNETFPVLNTINTASANPADYILTERDAGFVADQRLGSIGNKFFFDENANGQFDEGEPGISGITIQCWEDADASETPNDPTAVTNAPQRGVDNLLRTVVTDKNGEYYCTSLPSGQYIVTVADSDGLDEADDGTDVQTANPNVVNDNFAKPWTYALTTSSPNYTADFGIFGRNTISGTVFIEDESLVEPNGNGVVAPTELDGTSGGVSADDGAEGVVVVLYRQRRNGNYVPFRTTTTDANGDYSFNRLPSGTYRVEVRQAGSVIDGFGQTGDPDLTSNLNGNGDEDLVCDSPTAALCDNTYDVAPFPFFTTNTVTDVDFGYQRNFTTTPVTMNMFKSTRSANSVVFEWETSNEVAHAGFQIYAKVGEDWELLTEDVIGGLPGQALQLRTYKFEVATDATWFALVDISSNEEVTPHGPFKLGETYGSSDIGQEVEAFDWSKVEINEPANDAEYSLEDILRDAELDPEERIQRALSN